jgi:hypothetical protein
VYSTLPVRARGTFFSPLYPHARLLLLQLPHAARQLSIQLPLRLVHVSKCPVKLTVKLPELLIHASLHLTHAAERGHERVHLTVNLPLHFCNAA